MAERPFLRLTSKDFITGIAPSAHSVAGGLWYKARGISPVNDPSVAEGANNGLLRAGPLATDLDVGGTVVLDNAVAKVKDYPDTNSYLYLMGTSGHFYKVTTTGTVTDLAASNQIASPANGMTIFQPFGGTKKLYYWQQAQIGTYDLSANNHPASPDSHWVDNAITSGIQTTTMHPVHRYYNKIFYGNKDRIGVIKDDGSGGITTSSANVLQFSSNFLVTAIADDGIYVIIAITDNTQFNPGLSDTRIIFWDGSDTLWLREYPVNDQFIHSLKRVGNRVFAQGRRGIYDVSFSYGVRKVIGNFVGLSSTSSSQLPGPHLSDSLNNDVFLFAHDSGGAGTFASVASYGKLSAEVPNAFFEPIIAPVTNQQITLIESNFVTTRVFISTNNKLYSCSFGADTAAANVTAQTVYFQLPNKANIKRVEVVFGEPLVSGDSMSIGIFKDEDTSSTSFGSATFTADGATRRKVMPKSITVDSQMSCLVTLTAGTPKIKAIEFYEDREAT